MYNENFIQPQNFGKWFTNQIDS